MKQWRVYLNLHLEVPSHQNKIMQILRIFFYFPVKRRMKKVKHESITKAVSSEVLEEVVDYENIEETEIPGEMSGEEEEIESFEKPPEITIFERTRSFEEPVQQADTLSQ